MVKPFPTVLKIRLFLRGLTPHIIGLHHAVSKCASCCELSTGGGLAQGLFEEGGRMLLELGGGEITKEKSEGCCRVSMGLRIEWDCGKGGSC